MSHNTPQNKPNIAIIRHLVFMMIPTINKPITYISQIQKFHQQHLSIYIYIFLILTLHVISIYPIPSSWPHQKKNWTKTAQTKTAKPLHTQLWTAHPKNKCNFIFSLSEQNSWTVVYILETLLMIFVQTWNGNNMEMPVTLYSKTPIHSTTLQPIRKAPTISHLQYCQ